jgi:hypothetical protein
MVDVYTGELLTKKTFSAEHIIPRRWLQTREQKKDPINIVYTHRRINSLRSDFKYGSWESLNVTSRGTQPLLITHALKEGGVLLPSKYKTIIAPSSTRIAGWIDSHRRVFYPYMFSNRTILALACVGMIRKYPSLRDIVHHHVCDMDLLRSWITHSRL